MKELTLTEKIDAIDSFVDNKSSYTHYTTSGWCFNPYNNGLFSSNMPGTKKMPKYYDTSAPTFEGLINKVYDLIQKERNG